MKELDKLLKENLLPDCVPDNDLNASILKKAKETKNMKHNTWKSSITAAAAAGILLIGSVSAYAAYHYLTPSQVAEQMMTTNALSKAFESKDAININKTQKSAGYNINLMGIVSGKELAPTINAAKISTAKSYIVIAITREDGKAMPKTTDNDYTTFCVSPLIHGKRFEEINNATLNAGAQAFVQDGVQYQLLECDNLEIFANMGVYVSVVESFGQEAQAFTLDKKTGNYELNKKFDGMQALFELPLNKSKADDQAAEAYFKQVKESDTKSTEEGTTEEEGMGKEQTMKQLQGTKCNDRETRILTPDKDGIVSLTTSTENLSYSVSDWAYGTGEEISIGQDSDGTKKGTRIETLTKNEDGTFTYKVYSPK